MTNTSTKSTSDSSSQTTSLIEKKDIFGGSQTEVTDLWQKLRAEVMGDYYDEVAEEIQTMMEEEGISKREAREIVLPKWLPVIQKAIYKAYFNLVRSHRTLKKDSLHNKIMNVKRKIELNEDNEDWDEDMQQAIKRKKYAIQKVTRLREDDVFPLNSYTSRDKDNDSGEDDGVDSESGSVSENNSADENGGVENDSGEEQHEVESETASEHNTSENHRKTAIENRIRRQREFEKESRRARKELDAYKIKNKY